MILLRTLTSDFFATQQLTGIDHNAVSCRLYVQHANACVQTGQIQLIFRLLPAPGQAGGTLRQYKLQFGGPHNSNNKQVQLFAHFGWDVRRLLEHLDQQYNLHLRYAQVPAPDTTRIDFFSVNYGRPAGRSSRPRQQELKIAIVVKHVPIEQVFTPFALPSLAQTDRHLTGEHPTRAAVLHALKTQRLRPLPHPLNESLHVLDRVNPTDLAYPLQQLALTEMLVQDTGWTATKLPGNIVYLTSDELSAPLFLQVVKPSRSHVSPTGELVLRKAARIRKTV